MPEVSELLELAKSLSVQAGQRLLNSLNEDNKKFVYSNDHHKEIKAFADTALEKDILQVLIPTGLSILTEESGYISDQPQSEYQFIVDPLDGTFNYVKGLGPCAISIALWKDQKPIFGVIFSLLEQSLYWGGKTIGAYRDDQKISVSKTTKLNEASIFTGFPVRFESKNNTVVQKFWRIAQQYSKVRMLGSAAISLTNVAKGAADAYSEQNIMIWDVAAGLAIVEGAGGSIQFESGTIEYSLDVYANNGHLEELN